MVDVRFEHPSTWMIAGPSMSGKSSIVFKLLRNRQYMFKTKVPIRRVLYFYNQWQTPFDELLKNGVVDEFISQQPSNDLITTKLEMYKDNGGSIIIIDDKMQQLTKDISNLFTVLSHHLNITVFLLVQNLFHKDPEMRNISLNSNYILLTKNPRDKAQIANYAKQFAPGRTKFVVQSFIEATKKPYGYLLFDHTQNGLDELRVRSNIFSDEFPMRIWVDSKNN